MTHLGDADHNVYTACRKQTQKLLNLQIKLGVPYSIFPMLSKAGQHGLVTLCPTVLESVSKLSTIIGPVCGSPNLGDYGCSLEEPINDSV